MRTAALLTSLSLLSACTAASSGSESEVDSGTTRDTGGGTVDSGTGGGGGDTTVEADSTADTAADTALDTGADTAVDTATDGQGGDTTDASSDGSGAGSGCEDFTLRATGALRPVDIVWVIDASPSMGDEIDRVEAELNAFAEGIGRSGLDYRVILIGSDRQQSILAEAHNFFEICVPPPLSGAAGCPDTNSDRFLHVREPIHSREAMAEAMRTVGQWQGFLRPDSRVHFVFVTDDDERGSTMASQFANFADTTVGLAGRWTSHAIVDFVGYIDGCGIFGDTCSCGDGRGEQYLQLATLHDGLQLSICEPDWSPLFASLRERISLSDPVPCTFALPSPGDQYEVDYTAISVRSVTGAASTDVPAVFDAAACGPEGGWYLDNRANPTAMLLCPTTCAADADAVEVDLSCVRLKG